MSSTKKPGAALKLIQGGAAKKPAPAKVTPPQTMPLMRLRDLSTASPRLTRELGIVMAQAASVLLEIMEHPLPIAMKGSVEKKQRDFGLVPLGVTAAMRASHADVGEATHYGAYGVAILLARDIDKLTVTRKSKRGEGVDWWFSNDPNLPFTHRAEVSGIAQDREGEMHRRVATKLAQTKRSDWSKAKAIVIVVDFRRLRVTYRTRP